MRGNRRVALARSIRRRPTIAEAKLWTRLRNRQLDGLKFKRQFAMGRFVADFACPEHHLVVEVDGGHHGVGANLQRDADRTAALEAMGYVVLRFWNSDVLQNVDGVLEAILDKLNRLEPPHPVPLPSGARGPTDGVARVPGTPMQTCSQESQRDEPSSPLRGGETGRADARGDLPNA